MDTIKEEFDKKFGKVKEGKSFGEDSSEGESAGCDDCFKKLRNIKT